MDFSRGHVVPKDFRSIEIHHYAVVALDLEGQALDGLGIVDLEGVAEVISGIFMMRIGAVVEDGGFIPIAVTELGRTTRPVGVVKVELTPSRTLVGAVV